MNLDYAEHSTGVRCRVVDLQVDLSWYGPDIVRVRAWRGSGNPSARPSLSVTATSQAPAGWQVRHVGGAISLTGPSLMARIDSTGTVSFMRNDNPVLSERAGTRAFPPNELPNPEDRQGAEQTFTLSDSEALYGLGQFPGGVMNWRGQKATLIHGNVTVVVPFLVSTAGWGILWDNASHTAFSDGPDGMRLWSEVADGIDYYLVAGRNIDGVIAGYRRLTGAAPLFPRGFYGFIQSKERYKTADELVEVVREHRRRKLPLDVIVQDWLYWGDGMDRWSGMRHDPVAYGDLPSAIRAVHDLHAKVMISIWPRIGIGTELGRELAAGGHLFAGRATDLDKVYDAFSPEARAIYWRHARQGLWDLDIDAWWMDGTEPEFEDCHDTTRHKASCVAQRDTVAGSWARLLNAYSLLTTGGVYDNQRAVTDAKRVFILTRSAFAGQQRYGAATWSGDVSANWPTFAAQIPSGLNFCLAGIPYWTTDNGAFFVAGRGAVFPLGVRSMAYREFFLRWFQYSCFCPLMRTHGTQTPREIWHFGLPGETIYDALVDFVRLRMRLLPYSYSLASMTTFDGYTPMRALAMEFPDDPQVHDIADQFMYGPAIMACPVTEPMVHAPGDNLDPLGWNDVSTPDGKGKRLRVFDGLAVAQPVDDRMDTGFFDHNWGGNLPPGATSPSYRVEFTGRLHVKSDEPTALILRVAGRVRVDLGGDRVLDDWQDGALREHRIPVDPVRHRDAALMVTYGHVTGDAVIQLGWEMIHEQQPRPANAACERAVYLPRATWHDFWTGDQLEGGQTMMLPSPLARIPVLIRAGSILPLGPVKQWQDEVPDDPIELRLYPGADGKFTLYEDAGDSYAYEQDKCSRISFVWNDSKRALTIGDRQGCFPGMLGRRTFRVVVVRAGKGVGIDPATDCDAEIQYDGTRQTVVFETTT